MKFFKTIRDRMLPKQKAPTKKIYTVQYGIYHDGNLVSRFEVKIGANSKVHARSILNNFVEVKVVDIK